MVNFGMVLGSESKEQKGKRRAPNLGNSYAKKAITQTKKIHFSIDEETKLNWLISTDHAKFLTLSKFIKSCVSLVSAIYRSDARQKAEAKGVTLEQYVLSLIDKERTNGDRYAKTTTIIHSEKIHFSIDEETKLNWRRCADDTGFLTLADFIKSCVSLGSAIYRSDARQKAEAQGITLEQYVLEKID